MGQVGDFGQRDRPAAVSPNRLQEQPKGKHSLAYHTLLTGPPAILARNFGPGELAERVTRCVSRMNGVVCVCMCVCLCVCVCVCMCMCGV